MTFKNDVKKRSRSILLPIAQKEINGNAKRNTKGLCCTSFH